MWLSSYSLSRLPLSTTQRGDAHMSKSKSKPTNRAAKRREIDAFAEKLFSQFDAEPADITQEQLDEIEADFLGLSNRRSRRAALMSLAQSGPDLVKTVTGDRDTGLAFTQ